MCCLCLLCCLLCCCFVVVLNNTKKQTTTKTTKTNTIIGYESRAVIRGSLRKSSGNWLRVEGWESEGDHRITDSQLGSEGSRQISLFAGAVLRVQRVLGWHSGSQDVRPSGKVSLEIPYCCRRRGSWYRRL